MPDHHSDAPSPSASSPRPGSASALSAATVRQQFIDFFRQRASHEFWPSSPVVPHDDPTLLFANAGMNQFKPLFQGSAPAGSPIAHLTRAVNSQKCIRAGGKHNDLDDVGKDGYHHTFFEMLGNWSFGDYFKAEAIQWAWELLTDIWGVDKERLYATYFEGNPDQGLEPDLEARDLWLQYLPEDRVLPGDIKDNFWEMGDTGPCGPCSELHYDGRPDHDRAQTPGRDLVNNDHEQVIEIWNLVFIQFDRTETALNTLPAKHVDTGMGLERIVRVLQGAQSNYDTDVFAPLFDAIQRVTQHPKPYAGKLDDPVDTAYRVVADHIRTLCFAIADGAEPSNEKRGFVLRSILRRAVRYGRQTLGMNGPFFAALVPTVVEHFGDFFPELKKHEDRITATIADEEESFGRTIEKGLGEFLFAMHRALQSASLRRSYFEDRGYVDFSYNGMWPHNPSVWFEVVHPVDGSHAIDSRHVDAVDIAWVEVHFELPVIISAEDAFRLHDTYGFDIGMTRQMAEERGMTVDVEGFNRLMDEARERSRAGAGGAADPTAKLLLPTEAIAQLRHKNVKPTEDSRKFTSNLANGTVKAVWNGADFDETVTADGKADRRVALVLDRTNFYAEMGGQLADQGTMRVTREAAAGIGVGKGGEFTVEAVKRCGDYVVHIGRCTRNEIRVGDTVECKVDAKRRAAVKANHTTTHLLNLALRRTLGGHCDQKGSLVAPDRLRFDFAHNAPLTADQLDAVERHVNDQLERRLDVYAELAPLEDAKRINGVRALFGEAYPDPVRVVSVGQPVAVLLESPDDDRWAEHSVEFCGGSHLANTGECDDFVIVAEENVAKGVRRIVALTNQPAGAARDRGAELETRIAGAFDLSDKHLPAEAAELAQDIDAAEIPLALKYRLREKLAELQERVKRAQKQAAKAGREEAVAAARQLAESAKGAFLVAEAPAAAGDRAALMAAMDAVTTKRPELAVMLLAADHDESKVAIAAKCPQAAIDKGLKAGDWVRTAAQACGGKGGGRPDSAQGGGAEPANLPKAAKAAAEFADSKLA